MLANISFVIILVHHKYFRFKLRRTNECALFFKCQSNRILKAVILEESLPNNTQRLCDVWFLYERPLKYCLALKALAENVCMHMYLCVIMCLSKSLSLSLCRQILLSFTGHPDSDARCTVSIWYRRLFCLCVAFIG